MPMEISCYYLIEAAKKMGCWQENDAYVPSPGDAILYDWQDNGISDNTGNPDHVGTVIEVYKESGYMVIEEGNYSNAVKKRTLSINGKFIRGFITPKYDDNTVAAPGLSKGKDIKTIAHEAMREGLLDYIKQDYYLQSKESEHVMIVEKIQITSDTEDGNHVTVTGRSLESILDRRIVWGQKLLSGNLQNGIKTLLNENVISPSDSNRKISNFIFKESTDSAITKLKLEAQYTGDNLYDVIQKICEEQGIGFKITLNDEKQFVFELYAGSDRSYDQTENPYVIFSPKFENIINSNYIESKASLKTVTLVGGEGEGAGRRYTTVGGGSGLNRRELFTDARDISSNVGSDDALTDAEYMAQLQQRGKEKLAENVSITSFEGETETTIMFQYGKDFFNGDIVQIANEYGHETKARILEIVRSEDKDGYSVYPTFKTIEQEGA